MRKHEDYKLYYNIGERLGQGKFGEVYEATAKDSNEKRAIKILNKEKVRNAYKNKYFEEPGEEEMAPYIKCFYNEVKNMEIALGENQDNENAVKMYEYFDNENEFAIVMECCDTNLLNYLNNIKEEEKLTILNQLNKTIKIMVEDNDIKFIDLRLENILIKFVNKEKTQYIIKLKLTDDIGLMKQFKNLVMSTTDSKNILADPPEILNGEDYNPKSDLWSLGIIIYVLYFHEYPFKGSSINELLENIKQGENKLKKTGNSDLDNLIINLLKENLKDRMNWNQYFNHPFFVKKKYGSEDFRVFYEIDEEPIGNTEYATVYRGRVKGTGELRAIKVFDKVKIRNYIKRKFLKIADENDIKPFKDGFDKEIEHMIMVEGDKNENNNTVKFYEFYQNEDEFAVIMELCDDNLLNVFASRKEPYSPDEIGDILSQLNQSFKIMNKNKLVHRALNLQNILVKYENKEKTKFTIKLKLTDDSILLDDIPNSQRKTQIKGILFISPELLKNENVDEKCDLWSLGEIIYALAFKKHAFNGENENIKLEQVKNFQKTFKGKTGNSDLDDLIRKLLIEIPANRLGWDQYFEHPFIRQREDVRNYYTIGNQIGQSRFALIFNTIDKKTNELRAIKIYDKNRIRNKFKQKNFKDATDEDLIPYIKGFNNEINNMKILMEGKNNFTVKYYEHFHTNDEFAIVMELCDENMLNFYSNKKFGFNPVKIKEILTLLNYSFRIMSKNNIVHRALNLENILIKYLNEDHTKYIVKLKLTDDSLIKDLPEIKHTKEVNSNLFFISPEMLKKENHDEKCDLWSLGVIIYVLLFKNFPFLGNNENEILNYIQNEGKNLQKSGNPDLDDLIRKLLTVDPNKRISWNDYFKHPFFGNEVPKNEDYNDLYEIESIITQIGYATIYKAKDKKNKELRCLKIFDKNKIKSEFNRIHLRFPTEEEMKPYIESFFNEVNHLKLVQGQNNENEYTVKYYRFYQNKDEFVIVMELCDDNLLNFFAKKKDTFTADEIYDLLVQLNVSFKIMVKNKLVHRALNLENILIKYNNDNNDSYKIKLKLTNDSNLITDLPKLNKITGDMNYFAPEILKKEDYNEECDLWSLGVIIYALTFREHPFYGDNETELLEKIKDRGNNIKKINDPNLNDLVEKLLVEDPTKRITWNDYFNHSFFHNRPFAN